MNRLTIRNIRRELASLNSEGFDIGLTVATSADGFLPRIVPICPEGSWLYDEGRIVYDSKGNVKEFKGRKAVGSFAERYGIDSRLIRYQ